MLETKYTHKTYAQGSCMFQGENGEIVNVIDVTEEGGELELEIGSAGEVTEKDVKFAHVHMAAMKKSGKRLTAVFKRSMRNV